MSAPQRVGTRQSVRVPASHWILRQGRLEKPALTAHFDWEAGKEARGGNPHLEDSPDG